MKLHKIIASTALTALISTTAYAAPLADAEVSAGGIQFAIDAAGSGSYSVVIGGPEGFRISQDIDSTIPFVSLIAEDGSAPAPGLYTWTLTENSLAKGEPLQHGAEGDRSYSAPARSESGAFTILDGGAVADPDLPEGGFEKAQVFTTDLIVEGSACVGIDCSSSESFSFDTIRLKENNLRIKFEDTSTTASFPGNDWMLTANDSSNGGLDKFSIEDVTGGKVPFTIEAGARNNALYVEADGDVGIGTNEPVVRVHAVHGNTPTLRLEQDGSSGFASQTWDLAGNETNFFLRDVTNGSKLAFRVDPGSRENALTIKGNNVGVGTWSPDANLDVEADGPSIRFTNTGTGAGSWDWFVNSNTNRMNLTDDPTLTRVPMKVAPSAANNILQIGINATDEITINGNLAVTGSVSQSLSTGSNAGTAVSLCQDANGALCICGSCA